MARVTAHIEIDAPPASVWEVIEPIEDHAEWMADAESIEFTSEQHRGVGTTFIAHTKVGPIRLADLMTITTWTDGEAMGVCHDGVVTGTGEFTLTPIDGGRRTRFEWNEELAFPWYLGGPVGARLGGSWLLGAIWRRNLDRLRSIVENRADADAGPSEPVPVENNQVEPDPAE